jgi:hypothetical protein
MKGTGAADFFGGLIVKLNPIRGFRFAPPPAIHNSPLRGLEKLIIETIRTVAHFSSEVTG